MNSFNNKNFKVLIIIISAILIFFSVYFYLERIICLDGPVYLLNMVNYEKIDIPTNRFIAIFTQILPLLFIKLKASLEIIGISYSLNFMLFHIVITFIMLFKFKDYLSATMLLFAHVLSGNMIFYFPISEYQMGISLLMFFVSYLLYLNSKNKKITVFQYIALALILVTLMYAHPLMIVISLFYVLFAYLRFPNISKKQILTILIGIIAITIVKWLVATANYDIKNVSKTQNFKQFFPYFWETDIYNYFINHTISYNYFYFLAFVILLYYIVKKQFAKLFLFLSFIISYTFIVMIVNFNESNYNHYTEHLFQAIAYFIAIPLFYDVFNNMNKKIVLGFLIIFFAIKLNTLFYFSNYNGDRISWYKEKLKENPNNTKLLYSVNTVKEEIKYAIWIVAIESLIVSSIDSDLPTGTIHIIRNEDNIIEKTSNKDIFLTDWGGSYSIEKTMSKHYFPLDNSSYKYIKSK